MLDVPHTFRNDENLFYWYSSLTLAFRERFYGPKDCYNGIIKNDSFSQKLSTSYSFCFLGNIGDSNTAMGRIAYFDAHARRMVGDKDTFDRLILDPLINDVLTYTWLHERYLCDGSQVHAN